MNPAGPFPDPFPVLGEDEVHVWKRDLQGDETETAGAWAVLSDEEQARAAGFKVERPRQQFVFARAALRMIAGKYLQMNPRDLSFESGEHGKPYLQGPPAPLEYNISHTHNLALLAFTRRRPVGVDVEWLGRRLSHDDVAKRFFSPEEQEQLAQVSPTDRPRAFLECWTRKEAYLKARGAGLSRDTRTFTVALGADAGVTLREDLVEPAAVADWEIFPLEPERDYCGAVVVANGSVELKVVCHW
ncbi:MAG: 4'-phosphopantetheinyl transferase family protein [Verrucomicrobiia bacterium]|jgi:4'-phosphopantetheinyl transferase